MTRRISTTIVPYARQYTQFLAPSVAIGQLANYLSQAEANVDSYTLEVGVPIKLNKYIGDINIQSGDRLLIFMRQPTIGNLPPPLQTGDKLLRFRSTSGDISVHSRGQQQLIVGLPDQDHQFVPDIDLRYFIPHEYLSLMTSRVLHLHFRLDSQQWVASRAGDTFIRINRIQLSDADYPLQQQQTLKFYAREDTLHQQLLGEMQIDIETVDSSSDWVQLDSGNEEITIRIGLENAKQLLNVSDNIRITQIINGLARHNRLTLGDYVQAYVMHLVSPDQSLNLLQQYPDSFLYVPMVNTYAQTILRLTDVHDSKRVFTLYVGQDDEEKSLGFHLGRSMENMSLDVDLYPIFMQQGHDPRLFDTDSPYQAQLLYRADDNQWWIHLDADACMPVFINNERLTINPTPLNADDVISLGPSITNYYARLVATIGSRS